MKLIEEVREFIWSFINEDNGQIKEEIQNKMDIYDIRKVIEITNEKFGINIEVEGIGNFDSPGYAMTCYAWAGIIEDELYFDCLTEECY